MRVLAIAFIATASAASAQTVELNFNAGLGAQSAPLYFGSDESTTGVTGSFSFGDLTINGRCFGCDDSDGFGLTGSFRYIGARESLVDRLAEPGLAVDPAFSYEAVDAAVELGGGLGYTSRDVEAFAVVRRGFGGHEGLVAELGGDYIMQPSDALTLKFGPRLLAGDDTYVGTYFDTQPAFLPNTGFSAGSGVVSRGLELSASYEFGGAWGVTAKARYDELLNDAARSPLTENTDQTSISLVLTRDISFSF